MIKIGIKLDSKVLLLEDSDYRIQWFKERIPNLTITSTVEDAIQAMAKQQFDFFFLDHDLGFLDSSEKPGPEGDGHQFARHLASTGWTGRQTVIHSWNPDGAARMAEALPNAAVIPFGDFEIEVKEKVHG